MEKPIYYPLHRGNEEGAAAAPVAGADDTPPTAAPASSLGFLGRLFFGGADEPEEQNEDAVHGIRTSFERTPADVRENNEITLVTPILGMGFF